MSTFYILSHLVPSFPPILNAIPSQLHATDTRRDIVTTPASPHDCERPRPIPPKRFLGLPSSNPSFKSAAADPMLSFESSATITTMVRVSSAANSRGDFSEGWQEDAHRYGCRSEGERERETDIDVDISASSFNISLVSDTSTSTSTPTHINPTENHSLPLLNLSYMQSVSSLSTPRTASKPRLILYA
jgi:hypothetical protein